MEKILPSVPKYAEIIFSLWEISCILPPMKCMKSRCCFEPAGSKQQRDFCCTLFFGAKGKIQFSAAALKEELFTDLKQTHLARLRHIA